MKPLAWLPVAALAACAVLPPRTEILSRAPGFKASVAGVAALNVGQGRDFAVSRELVRAALRKNPEAKNGWEALIPSRKKEILRYFSWLKSPEARDRNVQKALHVLSGGQGRFMARSWNE